MHKPFVWLNPTRKPSPDRGSLANSNLRFVKCQPHLTLQLSIHTKGVQLANIYATLRHCTVVAEELVDSEIPFH